MRLAEKAFLLNILDQVWKEHLLALDHMRMGIHLRGYAQRDPFNEYGREAFELFNDMLDRLRWDVTRLLLTREFRMPSPEEMLARMHAQMRFEHPDPGSVGAFGGALGAPPVAFDPKDPSTWTGVSRNAPCPCGSGKRYKSCHGKVD